MSPKKTVPQPENQAALRRHFGGVVVALSGEKTISVLVEMIKTHPKYRKQYSVSKKYPVHDEKGIARVGERVTFEECRPLSKRKRWRLVTAR